MNLKQNFGERRLQPYRPPKKQSSVLMRNLRDCPPRLSKSPEPLRSDSSPTPIPTPLSDEAAVEWNRTRAIEAYDTLVQTGGRPTRPIRFSPHWKIVIRYGERWYTDIEEDRPLFHDHLSGSGPQPSLRSTEAEFIVSHWSWEAQWFEGELHAWQFFRDVQQWQREHRPDYAREDDAERQRYPQDAHLTASLRKLKDWKEYQTHFQRGVDRTRKRMERKRQAVEALQRNDPGAKEKYKMDDEICRHYLENLLKTLVGQEKRLEWVKQQLPAVLAECAASLTEWPTSRCQMEERSELEAKRVFNILVETGGRPPTRPIRSVPNSREREKMDEHLRVLCHWEGERGYFEEESREWKRFLDYRQKKEADRSTEIQLEQDYSAEDTTQIRLWKDYRAYRQLEVENAKHWVEFWQWQVEDCQETANSCAREAEERPDIGRHDLRRAKATSARYRSIAKDMKSYAEDARKQVRPAEIRLEWAEQQLAVLLGESPVPTTETALSDHLKGRPQRSERTSSPGQTALKNPRSNQPAQPTRRSARQKNENYTSAHPALGPINTSRVSKSCGRKAPRRRRQSTVPPEHGDDQSQRLNTASSSPLPTSIARRQSSRLSHNNNKCGGLEPSSTVGLSENGRAPHTLLRRSDRISKQTRSAPAPRTVANSTMTLQTHPVRRISQSKSKDRRADKKLDPSLVISGRVTKRRDSLRSSTKIHR